jgi:ketosteroid isomerase-like protein
MTGKGLLLEALRRSDAYDHDGFLALQADDTTWVVPGATLNGKDEVRAWLGAFWQAFGSYHHDVTAAAEVGDTAYGEGTWTGVHDGPLVTPDGEVPPTGNTVTFRWAIAVDVDTAAGVARSVRLYFDQLEFLGQLGLIPAGAAA